MYAVYEFAPTPSQIQEYKKLFKEILDDFANAIGVVNNQHLIAIFKHNATAMMFMDNIKFRKEYYHVMREYKGEIWQKQ